jgi:hypothetical protein
MVTGGPELVHQLVHEIRSLGGDARVHYVPDPGAAVPAPYRHYDVCTSQVPAWRQGDAVVYPETMLRLLPLRNPAIPYVWWQSYDNAVNNASSPARQFASRAFKLTLCQVHRVSRARHLFQSYYARSKLARWGLSGDMLSDYVQAVPEPFSNSAREPVICYNPKKGVELTQQIIAANPDLRFVPIAHMTKGEVLQLLETSMIYMDFGEHPGKDRLPREAALRGAVVVVGQRGSARNPLDVPLDMQYKLHVNQDVVPRAGTLLRAIVREFPTHQALQSCFRAALFGERATFRGQVEALFFDAAAG